MEAKIETFSDKQKSYRTLLKKKNKLKNLRVVFQTGINRILFA